jgi:ubiquinone/menaquinone biosynthesis C-methylase UbiE
MDAKKAYDIWHEGFSGDDHCASPWHSLLLNHATPARDFAVDKFLEIGCGRGGFSCWLGQQLVRPKEIIAADFSEKAVELGKTLAQRRNINGIKWLQADMQDIPLETSSVDTVVSFETIEHVPDPKKAINEVYRVLKPGGRFFLTTPNYFSSSGLYRVYMDAFKGGFSECGQPVYNWMFIFRTKQWLKRSGFSLEVVDAVGHYFFWPRMIPKAIPFFDKFRPLTKWTGLHSFFLNRKP